MQMSVGVRRNSVCGPGCAEIVAVGDGIQKPMLSRALTPAFSGEVFLLRRSQHLRQLGIIALQSTNRDRSRSRIVARLADGVVTTPRAEADLVVTEHGIAELRGRTLAERAQALIAVADPTFRAELARASERLV